MAVLAGGKHHRCSALREPRPAPDSHAVRGVLVERRDLLVALEPASERSNYGPRGVRLNNRFAKGLVVGKFCPLHRGHELLIDSAIQHCDEVVVISYTNPEFQHCGPDNRERWIAELFPKVLRLVIDDVRLQDICRMRGIERRNIPHNDAPDDEHRRFVGWLCCVVLETTVDAVFTSEDYGDGFAAALTRCFHDQGRQVVPVSHVCVDLPRDTVPICGTDARADPEAQRHFLAPIVYSDLMARIAILGGESSGKTTLAQRLAEHFDTLCVPEYGRALWERREGNLQLDDMLEIAVTQIGREQRLGRDARRWLFCDTTPLTTSFYSHEMFGHVDPALELLTFRGYQHIVVCAPDFEFIQDGTRRGAEFRAQQHRWYLRELQIKGLAYFIATGSIEDRLKAVISLLRVAK